MKKTLGSYLQYKPEEYPITLSITDFYYYECADNTNVLLHQPTGKKVVNFTIDEKDSNLLEVINKAFNLELTDIHIYDADQKHMLCHSAVNSNFLYVREKSFGDTNVGIYEGHINFSYVFEDILKDTTLTEEQKDNKRETFKMYFDTLTLKAPDDKDNTIPP